MNNKKMIAVFIALGMTMMCFSGCSLTGRRIHISPYSSAKSAGNCNRCTEGNSNANAKGNRYTETF